MEVLQKNMQVVSGTVVSILTLINKPCGIIAFAVLLGAQIPLFCVNRYISF